MAKDIDQLCINTIRTLSIDAIQKANSGHPGTPMALAPVAYTLWQRFLRFDPADPIWPNRDRFVLSAGHASMLLYSLLHLAGVQGGRSRLRGRRRARGLARGHRELPPARLARAPATPSTAGPRASRRPPARSARASRPRVGMAIASQVAGRPLQPARLELFDFDVYAIAGDGCLMEGVSSEAASIAGHLQARQPLLDLRQQPHHDRRQHPPRLRRRRRRPLHGLRLERHPGRRRQRPRPARHAPSRSSRARRAGRR